MTRVKPLHVSAQECYSQGEFRTKVDKPNIANLCMNGPHSNY